MEVGRHSSKPSTLCNPLLLNSTINSLPARSFPEFIKASVSFSAGIWEEEIRSDKIERTAQPAKQKPGQS